MLRIAVLILGVSLSEAALPKLSAPLPPGRGSGRLSAMKFEPVTIGLARMTQAWADQAYDAADEIGAAWRGLDAPGLETAAAPLLERLSKAQKAELFNFAALSPERRASLSLELKAAAEAAGLELAGAARAALDALAREIAAGRAGSEDLFRLERDLRALSVYGPALAARHREAFELLTQHRELVLAQALARDAQALQAQDGAQEQSPSSVEKPRSDRLAKGAKAVGYGLLGVSALAALDPSIAVESVGPLHGLLTYSGVAMLGAGRFLGTPKPAKLADAAAPSAAVPGWVQKQFGTFIALWNGAARSADLHRGFEARVGAGSVERFRVWLASAARTMIYWLPLALLGMFGGAMLGLPAKLFGVAKAAPMTPETASKIVDIPLLEHLSGYMALEVLRELFLLAVVFAGLTRLLGRWASPAKARWIAGALVLAGTLVAAVATGGYTLIGALPIVGFEAVVLALYARSGSLLAAAGLKAAFVFFTIDSARMLAYLKVPVLAGTLFMPPAGAGLVVLGLAGSLFAALAARRHWPSRGWGFLKAGVTAELARLKSVGAWWSAPAADGAPRRLLPMLAAGLLWAIPTYLVMDLAYNGTQLFYPQSEPAPEILRRLIFMPLDVLLYNFVIVAALEEWIFRKGVHKALFEKLKIAGKKLFWPAAILSSLIFSAAHYVDWTSMLSSIGVGDAELARSLAQTYAFTWAGFIARTAGGMILAFMYHRSGLLLVPMIAHFGSNLLESVGMRWGFAYFLAGVALIFALQLLRGARVPRQEPSA